MTDAIHPLTEDRRREIFAALVIAQDAGTPVSQSRANVEDRFGVTRDTVSAIEREGMNKQWPPL
jgi:hypothetical protein